MNCCLIVLDKDLIQSEDPLNSLYCLSSRPVVWCYWAKFVENLIQSEDPLNSLYCWPSRPVVWCYWVKFVESLTSWCLNGWMVYYNYKITAAKLTNPCTKELDFLLSSILSPNYITVHVWQIPLFPSQSDRIRVDGVGQCNTFHKQLLCVHGYKYLLNVRVYSTRLAIKPKIAVSQTLQTFLPQMNDLYRIC